MAELDVPVNNSNAAAPQVLEFEVRNLQYYFAKRQLSGGTPTGCVLYVVECGVVIGSVDIDSLTSDYQAFNTTGYVPCSSNYTIQFIETCSNTGGLFPTLDLANLTLYEAAQSSTPVPGPSSGVSQTLGISSVFTGSGSATLSSTPTMGTGVTCPQNNGSFYEDPTTGEVFMIDCYVSYSDNDITNNYQYNLAGCISACAAIPSCSAVNWLVGSPQGPCYLKSSAALPGVINSADYAAYLVSTASILPIVTPLTSGASQTAAPSGITSGASQTTPSANTGGSISMSGSVTVITSKSLRDVVQHFLTKVQRLYLQPATSLLAT